MKFCFDFQFPILKRFIFEEKFKICHFSLQDSIPKAVISKKIILTLLTLHEFIHYIGTNEENGQSPISLPSPRKTVNFISSD